MWFLQRLEPDSHEYLVPLTLRVTGPLDEDTLRRAVDSVAARHEILRTRYDFLAGQPVQLVDPAGPVPFSTEDLTGLPEDTREAEATRRLAGHARRPFDLAGEWPLRVHLVRLAPEHHVLALVFHHIACDAWSTQIFARDLSTYYRGEIPDAALPLQYADYAEWQAERTAGPVLQAHLDHWRTTLDGITPLELPTDRPRPPVRDTAGATARFALPDTLSAQLRDLAGHHRTTLFTVLLTAYQALLAKYCGGNDIAVGTVVSGRVRPELQQLIGYGINSLVMRATWDGDPRFGALLDRNRNVVLDSFDHQEMPFARLVDELQPERDLSRTPLFQAAFTLHESRTAAYDLPGASVEPFDVRASVARFDLQLQVEEAPDGSLRGQFEYATALFDAPTVERFTRHLVRLLHSVAATPQARLSELAVLDDDELAVVVDRLDSEDTDGRFVHEVFEAQVAATPDAVAVLADGIELTYAELNARANRIAHRLRALGAGPDQLVGICVERGAELLPSILGVLKSGAGYLPLDPANPADRLGYVLGDARATVVLTESAHAPMLEAIHDGQLVVLDQERETPQWSALPDSNPALAGHPDQLIYVIYTSGSTGRPKGVCLSHRNVLRLLTTAYRHYDFAATDVWPLFHSYAFDVSVWEMWGALLHGGKLVVVPAAVTRSPDEFLDLLVEQQVTVLNQTPSAFRSLVAAAGDGDERIGRLKLRAVVFAGEKLQVPDLQPWVDRVGLDQPALLNMYGITETTVHTTYYQVGPADLAADAGNPIGVPLADLRVHLLDEWGRPVPIGVYGEIHVAGPGVARGYLGRPALTAERFVPDPYGPAGSRLYRSGDIARRRADGSLEFLGRADGQIKIRGYRVELGEIQAALMELDGIRDAVVVLREDSPGQKELVAYTVPAPGASYDPGVLRELLGGSLPSYMVPAAFVNLDRLPLTTNGKLDRRALPAPAGASRRAGGTYTAPRTPTEERLADVWAEVLGADRVGVDDGFFDLGGDSIRAVALVGAVRAAGYDIAVRDVFEHRTVARLAELLTGRPAPAVVADPVRPFALIGEADRALLPDGITDAYPLSQVQAGMVLEMAIDNGQNNYHNVTSFRIRDERPYEHWALVEAARLVVARHEVLRTSLSLTGYSVPMQLVHARAEMPVGHRSLRGLDEAAIRDAVRAYTSSERADVFDLSAPTLMRLYAHDTDNGSWWLSITECHPVLEGWSHHSLLMEILHVYGILRDGGTPSQDELPAIRFADFIAAELESLEDADDLAYWKHVVGEYAPLEVPAGWGDGEDSPRATHQAAIPTHDLEERLRSFAGRAHVSMKSVMLAAHLKVMSQLTGETAFHTGLVCDARPELLGADRVYGMYLNTLPFAFDAGRSATWRELVTQVFEAEVALWPHRRFPMPAVQRLSGGQQLLHVYFNYQDFHQVDTDLVDHEAAIDDSPTEFPLTVSSRGGHIIVTANGRWVSAAHAERIAAMYRLVLEGMAADGGGDARAVLLPAGERELVLDRWNVSATESAAGCVPELFAARVAGSVDAVAVSSGGVSLSYGELDARSSRLAAHLGSLGVVPGDVVGVLLERGVELLVALLAVQKVGAAYLPMDAGHPVARLAGIVEDAAPRVLVTQGSLSEVAAGIHSGVRVLVDADAAVIGAASVPSVVRVTDPASVAYVLYTSGSTGRPKGVAVTHGALGNLLVGMRRVLGEARGVESWLASTSVSFDISGLELYLPLIGGHRVVIAEHGQDLVELVETERLTHVQATPSGWKLLLEAGFEGASSVTALVGGEALPVELAQTLRGRVSRLVNVYGPTETTIWSATWEVPAGPAAVSIGAPIDNTQLYIVDSFMEPVPVGVVGELCIAGDGVAQGYVGRPGLTADRFVPDPFGAPGTRLYRTGDLARRLADGEIEFLGRTDHQVKIRGYRIELGEIESRLLAHPAVKDAAVVARTEESGDTWLVGYLIPAVGSGAVDQGEVRSFLRESLPDYMVPGAFVELEAWPLNTAGKLDRKALPAPEVSVQAEYVAPRTETEERIAEAWATALGLEKVSVEDSFFDLGGDSIRAIVLVGAIRSAGFQVAVQDVFEHRTVAELARHVAGQNTPVEAVELVRPFALIDPLDREMLPGSAVDAYPVSQVQLGMLVEMSLGEERAAYHNVDAFRIRDDRPFDAEALQRATDELTSRHEVLRTGFDLTGYSVPLQIVHAAVEATVGVVDLTGLDEAARKEAAAACENEQRTTPFNTAVPPLIRVNALVHEDTDWQLVFTHAHPILEGWSYHSLLTELLDLYRTFRDGGRPESATGEGSRFADFIAAEQESVGAGADRAYWQRIVADNASFSVPAGWGDGTVAEGTAFRIPIPVHDLEERLRAFAGRARVSMKSVLLGAHLKVMSQLTEETAFHTGLVCDTRPELPGADRVYGLHLNTVPFPFDAGRSATWGELVAQVFDQETELWPHRRYPLPAIQRDAGGTRLLDVYFNYQDFSKVDGDEVDELGDIDEVPTEFPLMVATRSGYIVLTTDGRSVSRANAERIAAMYRLVLEGMAADGGGDARAVLLPAGERELVLDRWNVSATESAAGCVPELFAARVAGSVDAVAVSSGGVSLSYGELDARSSRLAAHLGSLGVVPGDVVGVLLERGVELLVALLAVQKVGAAYLPMDAGHPVARLAGIVEDAAPRVLVTQGSLSEVAAGIHSGVRVLVDADAAVIGAASVPSVVRVTDPASVAYVLYTSGSTGRPKGVAVTHGALGNLLVGMRRVLGEARGVESWLASTSVSFDISGLELYLPLIGGHRVVIAQADEEPADLVVAESVTHVQATPSGWKLLLEAGFEGAMVTALVGGEALPVELAQTLRGRVSRLVNVYGPTETTIWSATWEVPAGPAAVSIGAPIDNTQLYIVDSFMEPVPVGVVGELCIAGDGVAQGYVGRPGLTAERFVPDPFGAPGSRLYRTGDLARRLADGEIEFLGRTDHQVKIRGYRIELGEIESRLLAHPAVKDAAVVARTEESGDTWLVGYLIPAVGSGAVDQGEVRSFLRESLPDYMVPGAFVELEAWPLNTAGKLDRKALPAPDRSDESAYIAPRTDAEARIASAWETALGLERVSVEDSFFDLGGDSIRAVSLVGALKAIGYTLTVRTIFTYQTVAELADHLAAQATQEDRVSPSDNDIRTAPADAAEALAGALRAAGIDLQSGGLSGDTSVADLLALLQQKQTAPEPVAAAATDGRGEAGTAPFALVPAEDRDRIPAGLADAYPLSQVQTGMAVEVLLEGAGDDYHRVTTFRIRDGHAFSHAALETAARTVVARHEILRTSIDLTTYSVPMQLVHAEAGIPFRTLDFTALGEQATTDAVRAFIKGEEEQRFDLGTAPLLRVAGLVESDDAWSLALTHSHLVLEGWSHHSLLMELLDVYRAVRDGRDPDAGRESIGVRYADFIAGELASLADEADRAYWAETVHSHPAVTLPAGWGDGSTDAASYRLPVSYGDLEDGLRTLAERARVSMKSVLLAAHLKVMSQLTEEDSFTAGLVFDARPELLGADKVLGMHLNTVPFAHNRGATTWKTLVRQVFEREMDLWEHRRYPLPSIQRLADTGQSVVEVLFTYQNYHQVDTGLIDVDGAAEQGDVTSQFPLAVTTLGGHLMLTADAKELARPNAERIAGMYRAVLEAMADDPDGDALAARLPGDEDALVVSHWNGTATEEPAGCVPELFAARVAGSVDAVAVSSGGVSLSYGELDARSSRLAAHLGSLGVVPGDVVGVLLERGVELLVALLAVQKVGAAYLPMDAGHPVARLAGIVEDAAPRVLVTQGSLSEVAAGIHSGVRVLVDADAAVIGAASVPSVVRVTDPASVAYVLYTSGSTGRPKGVAVTHGALGNLLVGMRRVLGEARGVESWLASTSVSFDISGLELYLPLIGGHRVVIAEHGQDLAGLIASEQVTHVQATPSGWKLLLEAGFATPSVTALVGGEALPVELARELRGRVSRLVNVYGPTETTIWSATWEVPAGPAAVSIGAPIDNTQLYIVDSFMEPVPVGVVGELCIAGDGVAQGYVGRPGLTADRFVPDPFGAPGTRLYRTGDLARRLADGEIEFLGRTDHQVKIRGYRIELGEIESRLLAHPAVKDAAVVARTEESGDTWLVGYLIPGGGSGAVDQGEVRSFLRESLPDYMVPGAFVELEAWPLNTAGKLDRKALPAPEVSVQAEYVAPRTETEERIAEAWAASLGLEKVSVEDSFFDLGGDSIRAIVLVGAIRSAGFQVAVQDVFEHRTVAELARHVAGQDTPVEDFTYVRPFALIGAEDEELLPADAADAYPVSQVQLGMLVEMSLGEERAAYHNVDAFRIRDDRPFDAEALQRATDELTARHEVLRTGFALAGYSVPLQIVRVDVANPVTVTDLTDLNGQEFGAALRAVNEEESATPFDLERAPLLRVRAVLQDEESWWLVLTHAHPILEGWSYHSVMDELVSLYGQLVETGTFEEARPTPGRYADFIAGELASLQDEDDQAYWRGIVTDHAGFELPEAWGDQLGADPEAYESYQIHVPVHDLAPKLRELATTAGASYKSVILAAHLKVLSQLTEETSFFTGLAFDARPELLGADRVAGMHLNTVPFAHDRTAATWRELVAQVFAHESALWPHRRHPLPAIQRAVGGNRLLSAVFNYLDFHQVDTAVVDEEASTGIGSTEFPLAVVARGGHIGLRSDTRHLGRSQAARLAETYRAVLEAMAGDPDGDARVTFLAQTDRELIHPAAATVAPVTDTLHGLFAARAALRPDAGAVTADGVTLSYAELDARSNRIAHRLLELGVGAESVVGLCVGRGAALVPALLGVLKAGAAYLPMDPAQPAARLAFMAEDLGPKVVVTDTEHVAVAAAAHTGALLVIDGEEDERRLAALPATAPARATDPAQLAYIIYTSGSTGTPKGVGVSHANAVRLMNATHERFPLDEHQVWPLVHSYAFDVSVFEIWSALAHGSRLVVVDADTARNPDALLDLAVAEGFTILLNSPSAFRGMAAAAQQGDDRIARLNLRAMFFGGEKHTGADLRAWTDQFGLERPQLVELYGPTEATVQVTHHRITEEDLAAPTGIPLGHPLPGTTVLVLDQEGHPVPVGVPGELYLGGPQVSRGYVNRPALTAERFVPDPFGEPGSRLYRTGDLGRMMSDGGIDFLGRVDDQVKIRGYRVELGEIQAVLIAHPAIRQATVVTDSTAPGDPRIAAYVVRADDEELPQPAALAEYCRTRLPDYMVPAAFTELGHIPLISNTKVDRKALPAPDWSALAGSRSRVEPRTGDERRIAEVWGEVLGLEQPGVEDSFFEVGGDSIRAVALVGALRAAGFALTVRDVFDARTVAGLAALGTGGGDTTAFQPVAPFALITDADRAALPAGLTDAYPVSQGQLGILVEQLADTATPKYVNVSAFRVRDEQPLDPAALRRAVTELTARHEVLRTSFELTRYSVPLQLVHEDAGQRLAERDLRGLDEQARADAVAAFVAEERTTPFPAGARSLMRVTALLEGEGAWWLGLTQSHAITEGWSHHTMVAELLELYRSVRDTGEPGARPVTGVRYADFVAGELEALASDEDRDHWRAVTADYEPFELPGGWGDTRSEPEPFTVRVPFADVEPALRELARTARASMKAVLHAVHLSVLSRLTGQERFSTGLATDARPEAVGAERVLGMHLNTVPFAFERGARTWRELVGQVYGQEAADWSHRRYPLPAIQREAGGHRLIDVTFNYQDYQRIDSGEIDTGASDGAAATEFALIVTTTGGRLSLATHTGVLSRAEAERIAAMYRAVVLAMAADAEGDALAPLAAGEEELLLGWGTAPVSPIDRTITGLFAAQVAQRSDEVAVSYGDTRLSYAELDRRTDRLAAALIAVGAGPETTVAVSMDRSALLPLTLLAVLKTGAAYLPVDPAYPADRKEFMLADSGAVVLVTDGRTATAPDSWTGPVVRASLDEAVAAAPVDLPAVHLDQLAYVMYTSGSTGTPKATMITHRGVVRTVTQDASLAVGPDDVVTHASSVSFDAATAEIWSALLTGARLEILDRDTVLDPQALAGVVASRGVTTLFLTTSLFNHVARAVPGALGGLRTVGFGGEAADAATVRTLLAAGGPERLVNMYGPTENTTFSAVQVITAVDGAASSVPIGVPVHNSTVYVVDSELRLVPRGVPGELCVGGAGLARGYHGRPGLSAERFVPNPFGAPGERMYRTGDIVRWLPDGTLDFHGRADHQVKLRGYRIELGEVESALRAHADVTEAVVVLREDTPGDKRLVAYTVNAASSAPSPAALREHLLPVLPDYMVPAAFVALERLPLTAHGKLDTRSLPVPSADAFAAGTGSVAPRNPTEARMAEVWSEVLGLDGIGVEDSFFDLGGDSIRAVTLVGALKVAGFEATVSDVFEHRTVAKLAEATAGRETAELRYVAPFELISDADRALLPAGVSDAYPLAQLQIGMLVEQLSSKDKGTYHHTTSFDIKDGRPFDRQALYTAAQLVTSRHEALRTGVDLETFSVPMQLVHESAEMPVAFHDLTGLTPDQVARRVAEISIEEQENAFDVSRPTLLRLAAAVNDSGWRLFISLNHTIIEGWSHYNIWMEVLTTYGELRDGNRPVEPEQPQLRYADFIAGELESLASPRERAYWRSVVEENARFILPSAWGEEPEQGEEARTYSVEVSLRDIQDRIRAVAKEADVPVKSVLLAAHLKVLGQLTEEESFYSGLVCDARPEAPGADRVVGMYLTTLPIAFRRGARTWRELIQGVFATETELWPNRRFPLPEVQREAGSRRIIDVFFNYLDFRQIDTDLMDMSSSVREGGTEFDLAVTTMAGELGLLTNSRIMSRAEAERLGAMYRATLDAIVDDLDGDAGTVLLPAGERERLLGEWAGTAGNAFDSRPVHHRIAERAAAAPESVAVTVGEEHTTYGALNTAANRMAHHLIDSGVRRGDFVGVLADRGLEQLVAVLGVLKAGAAYLPLDPEAPADRMAHQLADSAARVLVTQEHHLAGAPAAEIRTVCADRDAAAIAARPGHDPLVPVDGDDLAYTIYTSGSTGRPKGVLVTHHGLANYLDWALGHYGMDGAHGAPMFGSIAFDLAVPSFLLPLISGRDVVVVPGDRGQEALPELLRGEGDFSIVKITPAHLDLVTTEIDDAGGIDSVRTFVVGGEEMRAEAVAAWRRVAPNARIVNEYGPTETVVGCVVHDATAGDPGAAPSVPIGRPITNTQVYVLDAEGRPVPVGAVGELHLGGDGVARGYHGRPALTAEKFVPHPFTEVPGRRLYRTGDLARFRSDGTLEFLGRRDDQVKIRGYRVELGEIEAELLLAPGVRDAVVLARQDGPGERRLVGYVVAEDPAVAPAPADLAAHLRTRLPAYMVPPVFVTLDELPLAVSGKVDRKALPAPDQSQLTSGVPYREPVTEAQKLLAGVWSEVLGVERVGLDDSFFALGGDSILVLPVISAARKAGLVFSLSTLYENETLAELADAVDPAPPAPAADADALAEALRLVMAHQDALGLRVVSEKPVELPSPEALMAEHQVPGISVAVIRDGEVAEVKAYGVTRHGGSERVTPDTLFPAGSVSKHVTALGVMRLAKDGVIDLDEDVNRYLTSWQVPGTDPAHPVTAERLLRFTGAVNNVSEDPDDHYYTVGEELPTGLDVLHGRAPAKTPAGALDGVPGQVFLKNNISYTVLQLLMEDVTGKPFPELMRELVLDPLGMTASHFVSADPTVLGRPVAHGHDAPGVVHPDGWQAHPETAAAGLWTTAAELARVTTEIRRAHRGLPSPILTRELTERMLTIVEPCHFYGMGVFVDRSGGGIDYGHTGQTAGYRAMALSQIESGTGLVMLANAEYARPVLKWLMAAVREQDRWAAKGELARLWEVGRVNPEAQD
ncbi:Tyrocidine synthase 3 [Streptomyces lavendulae subsp. lavendulae]|uniref:Tyrocidine synthase 3 n=17 Tax=Streptomyces lavendulae TaxID=1914 RepID=A0A2K8PB31_STRLA|nr:Tyrocidine synthase 3 [Streptomyces lavendulae subsp. lavendulae]QUQ53778.1 D-alanine--D-alanyl carrier protein ligase [Streptomyces lavendulae subsp. lavendulae]